MMTAKGEIDRSLLSVGRKVEKVPCGVCVTTTYFDDTGDLVREDVEVQVDKAALLRGTIGEKSA